MKIKRIILDEDGGNEIVFDNGNTIHVVDSVEDLSRNYADFSQLDSIAMGFDFGEDLMFEENDFGFRFGSDPANMFFVPCYSVQNGYYSSAVDIYYNNKLVLDSVYDLVI